MLKFFLDLIIKEELVDDRSSDVHNNKNTMKGGSVKTSVYFLPEVLKWLTLPIFVY